MKKLFLSLAAFGLLTVPACDVVRFPGDGRAPPADIPEGAPGPPPPSIPVSNPYGDEPLDPAPTTGDTDTEIETPSETPEPEEPVIPEPLPIKFSYHAPGVLIPETGTGTSDLTVYAPDMLFPVKDAPAFPQSMVYRFGGAVGGDQCDASNYSSPWQDNFCEKRSRTRNTPSCPTNKVHQGQDIRVGTAAECEQMRRLSPADRKLHEVVAVEDGVIQYVGRYWITLRGTQSGNLYNYIHLNMLALNVSEDDAVTKGQSLGYVSNDFGGTPTTFHLHFEIKAPMEGQGFVHVPPYTSLLAAYERRENGRGEQVLDDVVSIASTVSIPTNVTMEE